MKLTPEDSIAFLSKKLPILVVAYCRSDKLRQILNGLIAQERKVYVVIDRAPENLIAENNEVISCAESFRKSLDLTIKVNEKSVGVKLGVPRAIDFALSLEEACIIIEDDCIINVNALDYFDAMINHLGNSIALVSGDSPWEEFEVAENRISSFPLIWGWATSRSQWGKLKIFIDGEIPWAQAGKRVVLNPSLLPSIGYFLAAHIRVRRGKLQAWDCSVALGMLLQNLKAIIPNVGVVINAGSDLYAHHTFNSKTTYRNFDFSRYPASELSMNKLLAQETDLAIRKRIYGMKWIHSLSPLKALFRD
jgi:hypothetical protein